MACVSGRRSYDFSECIYDNYDEMGVDRGGVMGGLLGIFRGIFRLGMFAPIDSLLCESVINIMWSLGFYLFAIT